MAHHQIALKIYEHLVGLRQNGLIPVNMRASEIIGTVQDDPFDSWIGAQLIAALPQYDVFHTGKLTTPDILVRNKETGTILGLEVKKLIQKPNGSDPRGLTMDFNSCLPCGQAMINVGKDLTTVPCFYLFALLNPASSGIITLLLMDGDFLNYDFDLHKQAKLANTSIYGHGPYGEGSVRGRAMYTYPNPLNSKLEFFHLQKRLILKKVEAHNLGLSKHCRVNIDREDKYGNTFTYSSIDLDVESNSEPAVLKNIFAACKTRMPKTRVASTPRIAPLRISEIRREEE